MTTILPEGPVRRRALLRWLTQLGAMASVGPLAACGGGSGDGGGAGSSDPSAGTALPAFSTRVITGTVDIAQIGGNALRVQTPYQLMGPVQAGAFSTLASIAGAQVILVTDDGGRLRALAVVLPSDAQAAINADTTALGILFMSDGISTVNADEAAAVAVKLKSLPPFPAFASYLAAQLPTKDLLTLAGDAQFVSLRDAVVAAYLSAPVVAKALAVASLATGLVVAKALAVASLATGLVDGSYADPTLANNNKAAVSLNNSGYRFVAVGRQELDAARSEVGAAIPTLVGAQNVLPTLFTNLISGVNLTSWGNLATSQVGSGGSATDLFDASIRTNVAFYDYFVVGPGLGTNLVKVPSSLNNLRVGPATLATLLFYGIGPALDMVSGGPAILKKLGQVVADTSKVDELVSALEGAGINGLGFQSSAESGNTQNIQGATVDFALAVTGLAGLLTVAAPEFAALAFFAAVTGAVSALFSARSYLQTIKNLSTAPSVGVVEVQPVVLPRFSAQILAQDVYISVRGTDGAVHQAVASVNDVGNVLYLSGLNDGSFSPQPCLIQNTNTSTPSSTKLPLGPNFNISSLSRLNGANHFAISVRDQITSNNRVKFYDGISYKDIGDFGTATPGNPKNTFMRLGGLSDADEIVGYYLKGSQTFGETFAETGVFIFGVYRWQVGPGLQDQGMNDFRAGNLDNDFLIPVNNSHQFAVARFPGYAGTALAGTLAIYAPGKDPVFVDSVTSIPSCFMNNNAKVVYQTSDVSGTAFFRVFQNGQSSVLPPLPQISSTGAVIYQLTGLNDQGWIVGTCYDQEGDFVVVPNIDLAGSPGRSYPGLTLWIDDKPHPLASLIVDKPPGFTTLTDVVGINNKGQILAYSVVDKGVLGQTSFGVTSTLVLLTPKK